MYGHKKAAYSLYKRISGLCNNFSIKFSMTYRIPEHQQIGQCVNPINYIRLGQIQSESVKPYQRFVSEIERQIFTVIQSPAQGKTGPHEALLEPKFILFFNTKKQGQSWSNPAKNGQTKSAFQIQKTPGKP